MKICRFMYNTPPPWTEESPVPYDLSFYQCQQGNEVDLFCGFWPKSGKQVTLPGVRFHKVLAEQIKGTMLFTSSLAIFWKYLLWRRSNTPDVLHSHGDFEWCVFFYRKILMKFFPWHSELNIPLITSYSSSFGQLAAQVSSAVVFFDDPARQEAITRFNLDARRCFVLESGTNTSLFSPINDIERDKSRKELGLDHFDKVILYHGHVNEKKNVISLVEALTFLPDIYKLMIMGPADPVYLQKLNAFIHIKGQDDRVIKVGFTPYNQVPIAYQISDIFVMPFATPTLSSLAIQALACAKPCLVNGFQLTESIQGLYYLKDFTPKNIAEQIQQVVDSHEGVDIGKISRRYSWGERIKVLDSIYAFAKEHTVR